jgi:hypothetical protein
MQWATQAGSQLLLLAAAVAVLLCVVFVVAVWAVVVFAVGAGEYFLRPLAYFFHILSTAPFAKERVLPRELMTLLER